MFRYIASFFWKNDSPADGVLPLEEAYKILDQNDNTEATESEPGLNEAENGVLLDNYETYTKTGEITQIINDLYTVDNLYTFKSDLNLTIGSKISYQLIKNAGVIDVVDVNVIETVWNYIETDKKNKWCTRTLICTVERREGRILYLNPAEISINLNTVSANFVPIVGDWVEVHADCEVDPNVTDLTGKILKVNKICPLRPQVKVGKVTQWNNDIEEGTISSNIFFNKNALYCGYIPVKKEEVITEIIESSQGTCTWRALKVIPHYICRKRKKNGTIKSLEEIEEDLQDNYPNLQITENVTVTLSKLGDLNSFSVEINNKGEEKLVLLEAEFLQKNGQCSILTEFEAATLENEPFILQGECLAKTMGKTRELLVLNFGNFKIKRWIGIVVGKFNNVEAKMGIKSVAQEIWDDGSTRRLNRGQKPFNPARFTKHIPEFAVPQKLLQLVDERTMYREFTALRQDLEKMKPVLTTPINYMNYEDKFHTLLYLDEIHSLLTMRNYDQARACFIPNGEFLMLEIENLAEKRPSIIIGDRVIARDIYDSTKPDYEGFVHQVGKQHLYIKFSRLFHESYNGNDYAITVKSARAAHKRKHYAISLAIKNLGREVLFPSQIIEKESQVVFNYDHYNNSLSPDSKTKQNNYTKSEILAKLQLLKANQDGSARKLQWHNTMLNFYQKEAVRNSLLGVCRPLPYIIFGPPGTGKTVTVVEIVLQILRLIPHSRILLAAPSNSAADLLALRLIDSGVLQPGDLVRLVAMSAVNSINPKLAPYSATVNVEKEGTETSDGFVTSNGLTLGLNSAVLGRHRITVCTCISAGALYRLNLPKGHFTHVIIDEAGQTSEPEVLVPLSLLDSSFGQAILAGDPMQLGPVILSSLASTYGLEESFLERLVSRFPYLRDPEGFENSSGYDPRLLTKLIYNYRSLPLLLKLPSNLFYNDDLIPTVSETDSVEAQLLYKLETILPKTKNGQIANIIFHGVNGENCQNDDSPSWYNPHEAAQVFYYVNELYRMGLKASDVGIVTPYKAQTKHLLDLYREAEFEVPKIGTVEEFQGQEYNVIIVSTVRSSKTYVANDLTYKLGFVASPRRLNVTITRAKILLIIVGNPYLLQSDKYWRSVITYCIEKGAYIGCKINVT